MLKHLFDFPFFIWKATCQVSQDQSLIARKVLTATTSLQQIMRLGLKAAEVRAGPPPRSFSRTQQDSICQCIAASCRANLLRYEYSTVPSVLTELYLIFFSVALKSDDEQDAGSSLKNINKKTLWVILMTGGGHFVGSIFQG